MVVIRFLEGDAETTLRFRFRGLLAEAKSMVERMGLKVLDVQWA